MTEKLLKKFTPEDQKDVIEHIEINLPGTDRHMHKGFQIIPGIYPEIIDYCYNDWEIGSNHVFLASYPKTGKYSKIELGCLQVLLVINTFY